MDKWFILFGLFVGDEDKKFCDVATCSRRRFRPSMTTTTTD
jgi:hypothetical protein